MIPKAFLEDDLARPLFGAIWVGIVMASLDGFPRSTRLTILVLLLLALTVWLVNKRAREDDS